MVSSLFCVPFLYNLDRDFYIPSYSIHVHEQNSDVPTTPYIDLFDQ